MRAALALTLALVASPAFAVECKRNSFGDYTGGCAGAIAAEEAAARARAAAALSQAEAALQDKHVQYRIEVRQEIEDRKLSASWPICRPIGSKSSTSASRTSATKR